MSRKNDYSKYRKILHEARRLEQANDLFGAIEKYNEAIALSPEFSPAYYGQAVAYSRLGFFSEAINCFRKVVELQPDDATALHNLGVLYFKRDQIEDAESCFLKAIEQDPDYLDPLFALGKVELARNNLSQARNYFQRCQKFQPALDELAKLEAMPASASANEKYGKILVIMEQGIGNMIMLTPALQALRRLYPQAHLTVWGQEPALQVIRGWSVVSRVTDQFPDEPFDLVLVTIWGQGNFQQYETQLKKNAGEILTASRPDPDSHEVDLHMQLPRHLGYSGSTPSVHVQFVDVDFEKPEKGRLVALADTSLNHPAWDRKRWPYFRELAKRLIENGDTPVLIGGRGEAQRFNQADWPEGVVNCLGKYSVPQTAGLLKKCDIVVANDSGPAHIAAALDVPTFVLFGPTRIAKNKPLGARVSIITKELACSPCQYTERWQKCTDWRCLSEISVDDVMREIGAKTDVSTKPAKNGDVLIVGVLDVPSSTNVFMKKGFEELGYTVDAYNYRTRMQELGSPKAMWDDFKEFLRGKQYKLILFSKVNGIHPNLISFAGEHGKTWYWFMDNIQVAIAIKANEFVKRADFASATSEEVLAFFKGYNENSYQILEGFDPHVYSRDRRMKKKYDVVFVGNATEKRIEIVRKLKSMHPLTVFGSGWPEDIEARPPVFNKELRRVINQSKIVLNFVHGNIFSDRVMLTAACGGFVLSEHCRDLEKNFERKKHLDWFHDAAEAGQLIEYYLKNSEEREKIAAVGMEYVRDNFTWKNSVQKIVNLADQAKGPVQDKSDEKTRVLFVAWHGLGDNVMLTPALRKYKEQHPDHYIAVAGLRRFGKTLQQLLSGLPFVDQVIAELPDAWNDFNDYQAGVRAVIKKGEEIARAQGFDRIIILPTRRQQGYRLHKIFRFGDEVGVRFEHLEDLQTELAVSPEAEKRVEQFIKSYSRPILVLHTKAGNNPKTLSPQVAEEVVKLYKDYTVFEFGRKSTSRSILIAEDDMEFTKALIKKADMVVAIDSVVMHIAGAFCKPLLAIFTATPVHQAAPITYEIKLYGVDNEVTQLSRWGAYRNEIIKLYRAKNEKIPVRELVGENMFNQDVNVWTDRDGSSQTDSKNGSAKERKIKRILVTGPGHGGTNWATEIVRASGLFNFTEAVEDRHLFKRDVLPEGYATKLATENLGLYWENLKALMEKYPDLGVVFITRHPVDNCLSKIVRGLPTGGDGQVNVIWDYSWDSTIKGSVKSMEHAYTLLTHLQKEYPHRVIRIKMENLILDQKEEVRRLCEFLAVPMNDAMLEAYKNTRNRYHRSRYGATLDTSQVEMYKRWDSIYDGFFKNKKPIIDFLSSELKDIVYALGYRNGHDAGDTELQAVPVVTNKPEQQVTPSPRPESRNIVAAKKRIKLPEFYHNPMVYWAHMVTFRCNAKCPFCILNGRGRRQRAKELSGREIVEFWNSVEHKKGQRLSLIGGEPTLHPDIVEIVNNLEGYDITLTTNCKGPFYKDENFYKKFKPHPTSSLRINTTFHPHHISADEYIRVINLYRKTGYFVDQTSYVYTPDIEKHREAIDKVSKEIPITSAPYLGFYDDTFQFNAPFDPRNIEPDETYHDIEAAVKMCGLTDFDAFRDMCGQYEKRQAKCMHPLRSFIIGPEGNYYHCHYKLYYGIDPVSNIRNFAPVTEKSTDCRHYGFCNWCDVPRVGCVKNTSAKKLTLTKYYDRRELERSEIQHLMSEIAEFANQHQLEFNPLKWFEYSYCLLYSGHRHRGKVLEVGSAKSVFPYYLAAKGYDVTTIDVADSDYRRQVGKKFNVKSVTWDLREFNPELEGKFDLVSNLSVVEHIDQDTKAVLNLAKYLKPGGIMVVSTDFYDRYIEYPDANRTIVTDRPAGTHTDSRAYTPEMFMKRIIEPLEQAGLKRLGKTDFNNVDIRNPQERSVRGLYTFGISILRKEL